MLSIRSRKMRRILRLEARAGLSVGHHERALQNGLNTRGQAHRFLDQAQEIEANPHGRPDE
jgi:hypothetical protein